jgi:hypothetical protein
MARRVYVGPHDEVEIAATGDVVRRGESVEVDAELADLLDAQPDNWAKTNTNAARDVSAPTQAPAEPEPVTLDGQPISEESGK